jgi:hypothetical protein
MPPCGFEQVECANGVHVEIIEWNFCGQIVGRLRSGVDDDGGLEGFDELEHSGPIADIQFVVREVRERLLKPPFVPAGVALRAKEDFALVVVHAMHGEIAFMEISADFRANESGRAGDQTGLHQF